MRPSQYITTYGPGAILEAPNGPKVIYSLENSKIFENGYEPKDFQIVDQRLSESLLEGSGIIRIPTNAELNAIDTKEVYHTANFPSWSLCVKHGILYRQQYKKETGCPKCGKMPNSYEAYEKSRREAIRFIIACTEGHMDDVNWVGLIKHKKKDCNPTYLKWEGGGGSLKNVKIICPSCNGRISLGQAYNWDLKCTGRYPEIGSHREECDKAAKMMQRGASNLRVPEIVTSLTIPPRDTSLHKLMGRTEIKTGLSLFYKRALINSKNDLIDLLSETDGVPEKLINSIKQYSEEVVMQVLKDVLEKVEIVNSEIEYRIKEFVELQKGAAIGAPVVNSSTPGGAPLFEIVKNDVRIIDGLKGKKLRITPVSRLQVVMAQKGYKRLDTSVAREVSVSYNDGLKNWYPGVELYGEGIYLDLIKEDTESIPHHFKMVGNEYKRWLDAYYNPEEYGISNTNGEIEFLHPVFVWWHTFAHRIINSLSLDSGYSSASIRERVFIDIDKNNPRNARGGILLYTVQPGGDGTLGGLISLVPEFERILSSALNDIDICSNDPLCSEDIFEKGKYNGASCYACQLISETSCEHRNMFMDRNLLQRNLL